MVDPGSPEKKKGSGHVVGDSLLPVNVDQGKTGLVPGQKREGKSKKVGNINEKGDGTKDARFRKRGKSGPRAKTHHCVAFKGYKKGSHPPGD